MNESLPKNESNSGLIASPWHTLLVVLLEGLNAYRGAVFAQHSQAALLVDRPRMYLRIIFFEFLILATVIVGVRLRGASLKALFGQRWSSFGEMFRDLGLGIALMLTATLVVSILASHSHGQQPDQNIQFLLPRTPLEMLLWLAVSLAAGICEEAVYRGYFQRQFTALSHSVAAGILISAAAFGAVHAYQGWQRALVIAISAIFFGLMAHWRSSTRPGIFAHTLQDAIAPVLIKLIRH